MCLWCCFCFVFGLVGFLCCFVLLFASPTMLRSRSCLPELTTVRAVMVRAAMEQKKKGGFVVKVVECVAWVVQLEVCLAGC